MDPQPIQPDECTEQRTEIIYGNIGRNFVSCEHVMQLLTLTVQINH